MNSKELIQNWVNAFNNKDAKTLSDFYHDHAINHIRYNEPVKGRKAIRENYENEFNDKHSLRQVENIFEDDEWVILEWKDSSGLRGSKFFHVTDGKIQFQRGYWDTVSF